MKGASLSTRIFLKVLENAQHGVVEVSLPDGTTRRFGVGEKKSK